MSDTKQTLPSLREAANSDARANLKTQDAQSPEIETSINRPKRIGLIIAFLVFGLFGLWSALAPIDSAAHAAGTIKVKSYNKIIQHLEGGLVSEIRVQNGDAVQAGDVLLVMDTTQSRAQLQIQKSQLLALTALEARLLAEQQNSETIIYPDLLTNAGEAGAKEMSSQNQIFLTRKNTFEGSVTILQQRTEQLQEKLTGLKALLVSKEKLAESFADELNDFRPLLEEGYTDKQRLRELERNFAMQSGEAADLTANIAATEIQIGETRQQILLTQDERQNEVANMLAETQVKLNDINERVTALTDVVRRAEIKAPIDGIVNGLQLHTEGGVLSPGTPIAEIVPQSGEFIIEATVSPMDIDRVAKGQIASVQLPAFNSKTVPKLTGTVIGISADAHQDQQMGTSYYTARIQIDEQSIADLENFELVPGMPAEVFITTGSRTLLQYLMKPLSSAAARSFIED